MSLNIKQTLLFVITSLGVAVLVLLKNNNQPMSVLTTQYLYYNAAQSAMRRLNDVINSESLHNVMKETQHVAPDENAILSDINQSTAGAVGDVIRQLADRGDDRYPPQPSLSVLETPQSNEVIQGKTSHYFHKLI